MYYFMDYAVVSYVQSKKNIFRSCDLKPELHVHFLAAKLWKNSWKMARNFGRNENGRSWANLDIVTECTHPCTFKSVLLQDWYILSSIKPDSEINKVAKMINYRNYGAHVQPSKVKLAISFIVGLNKFKIMKMVLSFKDCKLDKPDNFDFNER